MESIFELLNPNNTINANRPLAHALGLSEAIVYAALLSKCYYYAQHDMLDEEGWFYSTVPDLCESTSLNEKPQKRCVDNLVKAGLIKCRTKGMPARRYFYIVNDVKLLEGILSEGEAAMRSVKPEAAESYRQKRRKENSPDEVTAAEANRSHSTAQNSPTSRPENVPQEVRFCYSMLRQNAGAGSAEREYKT